MAHADRMKHRKMAGFTLIELLIVVVIIGIIAAFAYPNYMDSVRKSRRSDARTMLGDIATRAELFYQDRKRYPSDLLELGYANAKEKTPDGGHYEIDIIAPPSPPAPAGCYVGGVGGDNLCYRIRATTVSATQMKDTSCPNLFYDYNGQKLPANCW